MVILRGRLENFDKTPARYIYMYLDSSKGGSLIYNSYLQTTRGDMYIFKANKLGWDCRGAGIGEPTGKHEDT